ncbi:MAG: hypothetical protein GEU78_20080 [Actinobacteria bacterium]|nr:hypothetical protein [Actinomycetota bacterium]
MIEIAQTRMSRTDPREHDRVAFDLIEQLFAVISASTLPAVRLLVAETLKDLLAEAVTALVAVDARAAVEMGISVSESVHDALAPIREGR